MDKNGMPADGDLEHSLDDLFAAARQKDELEIRRILTELIPAHQLTNGVDAAESTAA